MVNSFPTAEEIRSLHASIDIGPYLPEIQDGIKLRQLAGDTCYLWFPDQDVSTANVNHVKYFLEEKGYTVKPTYSTSKGFFIHW